VSTLLASQVGILIAILAQTGLIVWFEARNRRMVRSIEISLSRLDTRLAGVGALDARLAAIEARFAALDTKRNGGDHVAVDHPYLIEMRK
jgi:hypothetical protein